MIQKHCRLVLVSVLFQLSSPIEIALLRLVQPCAHSSNSARRSSMPLHGMASPSTFRWPATATADGRRGRLTASSHCSAPVISFHAVGDLRSAKLLGERPACIPIGRPRGAKAAGLRFQRAVGAALEAKLGHRLLQGPWFEYCDGHVRRYCQPDFIIYRPESADFVVAEAKLTWNFEAYEQLWRLYVPVVRRYSAKAVSAMLIVRNLTRETPKQAVFGDFTAALAAAYGAACPIFHYLGRGPV